MTKRRIPEAELARINTAYAEDPSLRKRILATWAEQGFDVSSAERPATSSSGRPSDAYEPTAGERLYVRTEELIKAGYTPYMARKYAKEEQARALEEQFSAQVASREAAQEYDPNAERRTLDELQDALSADLNMRFQTEAPQAGGVGMLSGLGEAFEAELVRTRRELAEKRAAAEAGEE